MSTWYSTATPDEVQRIERAWNDAPTTNLELCDFLFETAREQVIAYAPAPKSGESYLPGSTTVPKRLVYSQLQQARNLWLAGRTDGDGAIGGEFSYTPRPLDKTIKNIIRPEGLSVDVL